MKNNFAVLPSLFATLATFVLMAPTITTTQGQSMRRGLVWSNEEYGEREDGSGTFRTHW